MRVELTRELGYQLQQQALTGAPYKNSSRVSGSHLIIVLDDILANLTTTTLNTHKDTVVHERVNEGADDSF